MIIESIELKNPDYPDVTVKIGFVNLDSLFLYSFPS
jgi:hypothetical protein